MNPEHVVQRQLEAYNDRDIIGFMEVIDDNISVREFSSGAEIIKGYDACKTVYDALFEASPNLHSKVLTRTVFGNKVIDHEYITGRNGSKQPIELVLIYEVNDEKITDITVLREQE